MQKNKERKRPTNDIDVEEAQQLYQVEKEKCEELKKELTAIQSQLSEIQGFLFVLWVWLKSQKCFLWYLNLPK